MNNQIKVVIIDDGVNEELYNTGSLWLNLEITRELQMLQRKDYSPYTPSHGTTCGAVIKKYSPDAAVGSIKVLNEDGRGVRDQLIAALRWCADNEIKLVNLSLGTIDFRDYEAVRKAVNDAAQKGVIIIAACSNQNIYTHPASLSNVIGVKCDKEGKLKEGEYQYNYYSLDGIDITACSSHLLVKYDHHEITTPVCNSFAAPMITAMAYNLLQQNPAISLEEMKYKLAEGAVNTPPQNWCVNAQHRVDWIENALIFNVNGSKESIVTIPYQCMVKNEIDIECSSNREGIHKVREYIHRNEAIVNEVDTMIVNMASSEDTANGTGLSEFIWNLKEINKNLVYLDDHLQYHNICTADQRENVKIFHPLVYQKTTCGEKLPIDVPVIAVYDFSGNEFLNCIKILKGIFQENGYNAIAVSDTCRGIAAGIEYMPRIENVKLDEWEHITLEHINRVYNPDVILLGMDALNKQQDYFKKLQYGYEIDIQILMLNEINHDSPDIISLDTRCKTILAAKRGRDEHPGLRTVDMSHQCYAETLYEYIIELFKEDGKLMDAPGDCAAPQ